LRTSEEGREDGVLRSNPSDLLEKDADKERVRLRVAYVPWLLLFVSTYTFNLKSGSAIVSFDTANVLRILLVCSAGILSVGYVISGKGVLRSLLTMPLIGFLFFGLLGVVSGAYASEAYYAIWKSIEICVDILAVGVVIHSSIRKEAWTLYRIALMLYSIVLLSVVVGAIVVPSKAFLPSKGVFGVQLAGVMPSVNPNSVGFIGALLCLASFARFVRPGTFKSKVLYFLAFCSAFALMLFAQARTSFIALSVAMIVYLLFDGRRKIAAALVGVLLLLSTMNLTATYLQRGQNTTQLMSMSSRTVAWEEAWSYFKTSPVLGHGFASASRFDVLGGGATSTLHGSVFDVLVGVGLAGFLPWIAAILYTGFRVVWPEHRQEEGRRVNTAIRYIRAEFCAIYALFVLKATTSSLLATHETFFLLFLIIGAYSIAKKEVLRHDEK
jgi:hypothetical protein